MKSAFYDGLKAKADRIKMRDTDCGTSPQRNNIWPHNKVDALSLFIKTLVEFTITMTVIGSAMTVLFFTMTVTEYCKWWETSLKTSNRIRG